MLSRSIRSTAAEAISAFASLSATSSSVLCLVVRRTRAILSSEFGMDFSRSSARRVPATIATASSSFFPGISRKLLRWSARTSCRRVSASCLLEGSVSEERIFWRVSASVILRMAMFRIFGSVSPVATLARALGFEASSLATAAARISGLEFCQSDLNKSKNPIECSPKQGVPDGTRTRFNLNKIPRINRCSFSKRFEKRKRAIFGIW